MNEYLSISGIVFHIHVKALMSSEQCALIREASSNISYHMLISTKLLLCCAGVCGIIYQWCKQVRFLSLLCYYPQHEIWMYAKLLIQLFSAKFWNNFYFAGWALSRS